MQPFARLGGGDTHTDGSPEFDRPQAASLEGGDAKVDNSPEPERRKLRGENPGAPTLVSNWWLFLPPFQRATSYSRLAALKPGNTEAPNANAHAR